MHDWKACVWCVPCGCYAGLMRIGVVQGLYPRLWDAADSGDLDAVRRMIADGSNVEERIIDVRPALDVVWVLRGIAVQLGWRELGGRCTGNPVPRTRRWRWIAVR